MDDISTDFDLLVANAQKYNKASSSVYANSVKIRNHVNKFLAEHSNSLSQDKRAVGRPARKAASHIPSATELEIKAALLELLKDLTEVKDAKYAFLP